MSNTPPFFFLASFPPPSSLSTPFGGAACSVGRLEREREAFYNAAATAAWPWPITGWFAFDFTRRAHLPTKKKKKRARKGKAPGCRLGKRKGKKRCRNEMIEWRAANSGSIPGIAPTTSRRVTKLYRAGRAGRAAPAVQPALRHFADPRGRYREMDTKN